MATMQNSTNLIHNIEMAAVQAAGAVPPSGTTNIDTKELAVLIQQIIIPEQVSLFFGNKTNYEHIL